ATPPSSSENCGGLRRDLRLRSSRWPAAEIRAPPAGETPAPLRDLPGCASIRARETAPAAHERRPGPTGYLVRSSMANRTTRKRARVLNPVLVNQLAADGLLVAGRLVPHGGDEFARSYVLLGVAVTVETPLHLERVLLPSERHSIHPAMAALTSD